MPLNLHKKMKLNRLMSSMGVLDEKLSTLFSRESRTGYQIALVNSAIFLLLSLIMFALEPDSVWVILSAPILFFSGIPPVIRCTNMQWRGAGRNDLVYPRSRHFFWSGSDWRGIPRSSLYDQDFF